MICWRKTAAAKRKKSFALKSHWKVQKSDLWHKAASNHPLCRTWKKEKEEN
jgi:hypothetical protein